MPTPNLSTFTRVLLGLALAILGGLAFTLAFPPYEIWPLALVGYVPVLIAQGAQFIVWPEGALICDPQAEDRLSLRGLAAETDMHR